MTPRDYREAWAWVHLLLHGPEAGKSLLMAYLGQTDPAEGRARLRPRLAEARIDEQGLVNYLKALQSGPVASATPSQPGTVRFQDQPVEPAPMVPPRGLFRRLGAWLGF